MLFEKRLNVVQTGFSPDIRFSMRTFWFMTDDSSNSGVDNAGQEQTMQCDLRLNPIDAISSTQPEDCTCYTKERCAESGYIRSIIS